MCRCVGGIGAVEVSAFAVCLGFAAATSASPAKFWREKQRILRLLEITLGNLCVCNYIYLPLIFFPFFGWIVFWVGKGYGKTLVFTTKGLVSVYLNPSTRIELIDTHILDFFGLKF